MKRFDKLVDKLRERYDVKKISEDTYSVSNGERSIEIHKSDVYDPAEIDRFFDGTHRAIGDFGHVGEDDLFPDFGTRNVFHRKRATPRGPLVGPGSSIFRPVEEDRHDSSEEESNPLVRIDPITPSRRRRKGFEPDPDHFKKPDGDGKPPF